jgi:hypothetical protein
MGKWARTETNDHVLIEVTMFIAIGVPEELGDLPSSFTHDLREAVKSTGAGIITSSISPRHRQKFHSTAREILSQFSETVRKTPS